MNPFPKWITERKVLPAEAQVQRCLKEKMSKETVFSFPGHPNLNNLTKARLVIALLDQQLSHSPS